MSIIIEATKHVTSVFYGIFTITTKKTNTIKLHIKRTHKGLVNGPLILWWYTLFDKKNLKLKFLNF